MTVNSKRIRKHLSSKTNKNHHINKNDKKEEPPKKNSITSKGKIDLQLSKNNDYNSTSRAFINEKENNSNARNKIKGTPTIINIKNLQIKSIGQNIKVEKENEKSLHKKNDDINDKKIKKEKKTIFQLIIERNMLVYI